MRIVTIVLSFFVLGVISTDTNPHYEETIVLEWTRLAVGMLGRDVMGSRQALLMYTSMYNAWAAFDSEAISTDIESFTRQPESERTSANKHTAVSYAAYYILITEIPENKTTFDDFMHEHGYTTDLSDLSSSAAQIGVQAAKLALEARQNDNSNYDGSLNPSGVPYSEPILLEGYTPFTTVNTIDDLIDINHWQPRRYPNGTIQEFQQPYWGIVTPFSLTSGSQFRPDSGPITTEDYSDFLEQGYEVYNLSQSLTEEQKLIARYWGGEVQRQQGKPGELTFWNGLAPYVSVRDRHSLDDDVKMFFAVYAAFFDLAIAVWDSKAFYNSVRPITLIQNLIDPEWEPYLPTPDQPEYVGGSAAACELVAEVLRLFTSSDAYGGSYYDERTDITLSWPTFTNAQKECSMSRLYAGAHFTHSNEDGQTVGRLVARKAWEKVSDLIHGRV